jgi:hypothetical protein
MRITVYAVLLGLLMLSTTPQAAGVLIPKQTLAKIKAQAAQDHPDDYAVQEYVIKTQTKAYYEVKNYKNKKVPKGMDLSDVSQAKLNAIARRLNERPRKTLNFESPAELFNQCVASIG